MFYGITFMRISVHAVRRREQKTRVLSFHCPVIVVFLIILLFCHPPTTLAQETDDDVLHYAYSVVLGTGVYRVGDRTVTIINLPFSYEMRSLDDHPLGIRFLFPLSFGFHDFDFSDVTDTGLPERVGTLTFVPGMELQIPVCPSWTLKPYGQVGLGKDFSSGEVTFIYIAGVKSRLVLPRWRDLTFTLGNELYYAGYTPEGERHNAMGSFATGMDIVRPLGFTIKGRQAIMGFYFIYRIYFNELQFIQPDGELFSIEQDFDIAIRFGTKKPISFWVFDFESVGLGYRFGDDIKAVYLVSTFPF